MNSRIKKLLSSAGIPSTPECRGQMDTLGYAVDADQLIEVIRQGSALADPRTRQLDTENHWTEKTRFKAVICPHDDYTYASRLYHLALSRIRARRVILLGVSHKARLFGYRDRLIFDGFREWRTPRGTVPVSSLRDEIMKRMPENTVVQSSDCHGSEHSLEGIVHYLHGIQPDLEIVPILVPFMGWKTIELIAQELSKILADIMKTAGWIPGEDIAWVISNDGVHYGDAQWGGGGYAPFGTTLEGYREAVSQDMAIMSETLTGPVSPEKTRDFFHRCCDPGDVTQYRVTWCGRFAIAFGLSMLLGLTQQTDASPIRGFPLDYGTSVSESSLDLTGLGGLGVTAPNNFHHFVGYPAVAYL